MLILYVIYCLFILLQYCTVVVVVTVIINFGTGAINLRSAILRDLLHETEIWYVSVTNTTNINIAITSQPGQLKPTHIETHLGTAQSTISCNQPLANVTKCQDFASSCIRTNIMKHFIKSILYSIHRKDSMQN